MISDEGSERSGVNVDGGSLSYQALRFIAERNIPRKVESVGPVHNLFISIMWIVSTERRPADKTLEHDGSHRPPVAAKWIALPAKNFWGDVVRGSNGGIGHDTTGFPPCVDLPTVGDSEIDLI